MEFQTGFKIVRLAGVEGIGGSAEDVNGIHLALVDDFRIVI